MAFCRRAAARVARVKSAILSEFRHAMAGQAHLLRLAVNEAEALAWESGYPHLFFPALAAEKVQALARWQVRQRTLRQDSRVS